MPLFPPELPPTAPVLPAARLYDPLVRDYPLDATGQCQPVHPVDQQVALILCTELGSVPSLPTLGTRYRRRIERCDPKKILRIAIEEANAGLRDLIARGDVRILSVTITPPAIANIAYVNLRAPGKTTTPTVAMS
jgi:hypothetical protein